MNICFAILLGLHVIERKKLAKKEQIRELFKGLLLEKGCNFNWQWRRDVMNKPIQNVRAVHCRGGKTN